MTVYNKEKPEFLDASINSMINQTIKPDEIVIVKDGKLTEQLDKVIETYINKAPEIIKIISLESNVGLALALEEGLRKCKNELVARMDSDDSSLPERCELQLEEFRKNPQLSIVGTNIDEFYDNPTNIVSSRIVPSEHKEIVKFIKRRSPFNHPSVMYKKSEVKRCGGYGKLRRKQDFDLFSRMINNGCIACNIDKSLVLFRSNLDSFKRRKSWINCKSYIEVEFEIWKRGHCSFIDFAYVTVAQIIMTLAPISIVKWLSNKFLREDANLCK